MTIKEAILKSLDDISGLTNYLEVCKNVIDKGYFDFGSTKNPSATISSKLSEFIKTGDSRVKRIKQENGSYIYYLTKNESNIGVDVLSGSISVDSNVKRKKKIVSYQERDLHKILSSYL